MNTPPVQSSETELVAQDPVFIFAPLTSCLQVTRKFFLSIVAMTAELISAFLVVILKWLELDDSARPELLEKMECFAECLTRVIRHMSVSSLTEH